MEKKERIVIKVGSNVLTRNNGSLDITRISSIVDQIAKLLELNYDVILVTSGAVACGRRLVNQYEEMDEVSQRQLFSAVGQVRLMDLYFSFFKNHELTIGQVLTMKENFNTGEQYDNQKNCIEVMLRNGVVPIINENDTVSITELMFTDNDELSGLVASMVKASKLILLTSVDGIYMSQEHSDKIIRYIKPDDDITPYLHSQKSASGRGGMITKYNTAKKIAGNGIGVIIANGKKNNILTEIITNPEKTRFTEFLTE